MSRLLHVENLTIGLPDGHGNTLKAVAGVEFTIDAGEVVGIAGESGCGKTLTALSLLHLLPHGATVAGQAVFKGRDLLALRSKEMQTIRGNEIGFVFQDPGSSLHPMLTVEQQLTEHVRSHLGVRRAAARARAERLLETVRIPDPPLALRAYPHQFSGGMRQRIAIAMALACAPALLIADEPTTALDVTVQAGILALLDELRREEGLSVMLITHDLSAMSAVADRLYVFYAGRVIESGPVGQLLPAPHHPYTVALMGALPDPGDPKQLLLSIDGAPPHLGAIPSGCAFHPRCAHVRESCRTSEPVLRQLTPQRVSRCPVVPFSDTRATEMAERSA